MDKNVLPFPGRKKALGSTDPASVSSRITVRVGRQRYAIDMSCSATALPEEPEPVPKLCAIAPLVETKYLRLRQAVMLGERIDGWRVCWLGGWDRGRVFYVVMVERKQS